MSDLFPKQKTKGQPSAIDLHVGRRLHLQRNFLGFSREELARALDVTFQQLQKYESGANRVSAGRLYLLALILRVPITYFYETLPAQVIEDMGYGGYCRNMGQVLLARSSEIDTAMNRKDVLEIARNYLYLRHKQDELSQHFRHTLRLMVTMTGGDSA